MTLANLPDNVSDLIKQNETARNAVLKHGPELSDKLYKPLIIVGPSGVGKSTLIGHLTENCPPNSFGFSVSYTTRAMRPGEEHGKNYFFVSKEDFQKMIDADDFIECHEYVCLFAIANDLHAFAYQPT